MATNLGRAAVAALVGLASVQLQGCTPDIFGCGEGRFCIYENEAFESHRNDFNVTDYTYTNNSWPGTNDGLDDETSSWANNTGCPITIYREANHMGTYDFLEPFFGTWSPSMDGNVGDNQVSSHIKCS